MHLSSIQMLLLAVVAITSAPRTALGQASPTTCALADVSKGFCSSCWNTTKCEKEGLPPVAKTGCKPGEACIVLQGKFAVCKPVAETPCACGTKSQKCDAYDPDSINVCLSGSIAKITSCKTQAAPDGTCIDNKCGTAPPEETTVSLDDLCGDEDGFFAVTPACTSAVYCSEGDSLGPTDDCQAGEYYDVDELACFPAPPPPCPVGCGTGACGDKNNCSKWYICDAGAILDEEICEAPTEEFNTEKFECVAAGAGTCSKNTGCNFNLAASSSPRTSSTPSTTSSSTKSTPSGSTTSTRTNTIPTITTTSTKTITSSSTPSTKTSTAPPTSSSTSSSSSSTTSTSTATSRPSTCGTANVGNRYPFEGNCKKYYSCRLVSTNVYAYVEASCLAALVFNAKTGYCDTLANVPGCVPPA